MINTVFFFQHPFLQGDLSTRYTKELLDKLYNPTTTVYAESLEDDEVSEQLCIQMYIIMYFWTQYIYIHIFLYFSRLMSKWFW